MGWCTRGGGCDSSRAFSQHQLLHRGPQWCAVIQADISTDASGRVCSLQRRGRVSAGRLGPSCVLGSPGTSSTAGA
eukprot:7210317-Prymnesium_polylepis.1